MTAFNPNKFNLQPNIKLVESVSDDDLSKDDNILVAPSLNNNEIQLSRSFAIWCQDRFKYVQNEKAWLNWSKAYWEHDVLGKVSHDVSEIVLQSKFEDKNKRSATVRGVMSLVQNHPLISIVSSQLDSDPFLLGTPEGTVELKTGKLRPAERDDLITKLTLVGPKTGRAVKWLQFLNEACKGDQTYVDYLQLVSGYCLTADTSEEVLFFLYGLGGNGKGVFMHVLSCILKNCCKTAPDGMFEIRPHDPHPQEVASLQGARLVISGETTRGRKWNETRIKARTGRDPVTAHFMRCDGFTFLPKFKLMLAGNNQLDLTTIDDAIERRFIEFPFDNQPEIPNLNLKDELVDEEASQILQWMMDGCTKWQALRLKGISIKNAAPKVVRDATNNYIHSQDKFLRWLELKYDFWRDVEDKNNEYDTYQVPS
jgi:putative DNA primase/helicase